VGVHPGAAWATKRWLPERFAELCRRLSADGFTPVLVGGPADAELGAAIARARGYVHDAIRTAPGYGTGHGPLNHAVTVRD